MKPFEEPAVIRYIENNQYNLTVREVAECFGTSMTQIKELIKRKNIKLPCEKNTKRITKDINKDLKKIQEEIERKVDSAHMEWYRNKLDSQLVDGPITVRHTDIGIEDVWDKIKHEYVYTVICPFERTYEIKRRLQNEKLQANNNNNEGKKNIENKESVAVGSICGNDNSNSNKRVDTKFKKGNDMNKINQETKDKFITYYIEQRKLKKRKKEIATEQKFFSYTTATRVMKDVDSWTEQEWKEFEARQANVSNEVKKEPVSEIEQFEEEETETLDEIAAKNEELKKELHSQKVVVETLQKGVEELNEAITESKIMIAEVAKERDDKDEEIRVLNLELQKYKNDIKMEIDDRQKLECLLSDNANAVELNPKYDSLYKVLLSAYNQASNGKGKERHQLNNDEPFENQKICEIARRLSIDYNLGQAVKKIYESKRLADGRDIAELYGAINYIAAAIIVKQEEKVRHREGYVCKN